MQNWQLLALAAFIILALLKFFAPAFFLFNNTLGNIYYVLYELLIVFCVTNVMLACFNLIPIPPLDGSKIFFSVLPDRLYYKVMSYDRYMIIISLILVYFGVLDNVIFNGTTNLIRVLDTASSFIYNLIGNSIGGVVTEIIATLSVIIGIIRHDIKDLKKKSEK